MADIARLAVGTAILDSNDEIVGQERGENVDLPQLVRFGPLQFHGTNVGSVRFLLRRQSDRESADQGEAQGEGQN